MILNETFELLKTRFSGELVDLKIMDVRMGVFMTAIRLSDNSYGISSTLPDILIPCDKDKRDLGDFTPNKIKGQSIISLFETTKQSKIIDTLRIAALNAISSKLLLASDYRIIENADPIDLIDLNSRKTITLVGAFQSYIKKISENGNKLYVLELNENALREEHKQFFVPAQYYEKVLQFADIVIITGLTLVNNTLDDLLACIMPETQIIVTGPSSSIIPDVLFAHNVKIIGATRITNPDLLFSIVGEASAGFHLFQYCAQKICILND
ncbi:MAG: DUF364 domain-containing protein [Bacteroidetes bacterium]|nr:DUF364 domain-containing protein [Bacteroidota bacterium]